MDLGQAMVGQGIITPEQLEEAQAILSSHDGSIVRALLEKRFVTQKQVTKILAEHVGREFIDFEDMDEIDVSVLALTVDPVLLRRHIAMPVRVDGTKLIVAMSDPSNINALDDISAVTNYDAIAAVGIKDEILEAIDKFAAMSEDIDQVAEEVVDDDDVDDADLSNLNEITDDAPIVKFVNTIVSKAVADGASDIHIEPTEKNLRVRYRIDGVLHEPIKPQPKKIAPAVISRLKIMANVDIAEKRVPQDGRFSVKTGGKSIDMRFSTLPTVYGEKIVMRILDTSSIVLTLNDLGFLEDNLKRFEESYTKPYGMILVTGPTGSGKSTTLYATINVINQEGVNITTTEDPVEYRLAGINQVQVNSKVGLTFASALRSILRQDPDIVLVGEMRDRETAQIGIEAALTGHLVLSTLHTNDAPSAVTRLTEMGIEPFLVGSAVDCVLAQRLARKICSKCADLHRPEAEALRLAGFPQDIVDDRPEIVKAVGCKACSNTGYKGRLAVHEVMTVTEEIERLAVARASSEDIGRVAREQGMKTLRDDGLSKVIDGLTTIEEVGRVIV